MLFIRGRYFLKLGWAESHWAGDGLFRPAHCLPPGETPDKPEKM